MMAKNNAKSLLQLAKESPPEATRPQRDDNERIDLCLALIRGEVTGKQCDVALNGKRGTAVRGLSYSLLAACIRGDLEVIDKRNKNRKG